MHFVFKAALAVGAATIAGAAFAQPAPAPWNPDPSISASLDIGGSGSFTGVFDNHQLCYMIDAAGVANPTAAVIRSGKKADNGAVVLNLSPPVGGASGGCIAVPDDVAHKLVSNAGKYWFEIDSAAYPQGAAGAWLMGQNG